MPSVMRMAPIVVVVSVAVSLPQAIVVRAQDPAAPAAAAPGTATLPWMNPSLPPAQRADLLIAQMTLAQKVEQLANDVRPAKDAANRPPGCGFEQSGRHIQGIPELGI